MAITHITQYVNVDPYLIVKSRHFIFGSIEA